MSEIKKMYENAGVEKDLYCCDDTCGEPTKKCKDCSDYREIYPQFTAKKQIELIKWLAKRDYGDYTSSLLINITDDRVYFSAAAKPKNYVIEVLYDSNRCTDFENALANLINSLWQDLTEEEKQQVKGILE